MLEQYQRVIFTTGTFDCFHFGHVKFLKEASTHGDCLLVGLHSDRTVWKYKGRYPVMNLMERIAVIQACKYVNIAIVAKMTSEMDESFYEKWNISLHVQGDEEPGWYELPKRLGIFKLLPECKVFSSTKMKERIIADHEAFKINFRFNYGFSDPKNSMIISGATS